MKFTDYCVDGETRHRLSESEERLMGMICLSVCNLKIGTFICRAQEVFGSNRDRSECFVRSRHTEPM
jgi:hypothetical protein